MGPKTDLEYNLYERMVWWCPILCMRIGKKVNYFVFWDVCYIVCQILFHIVSSKNKISNSIVCVVELH